VLNRPLAVALAVVAVYGLWLATLLRTGTDPMDFVHIGRQFATRSHSSPAISDGVSRYRYDGQIGYDGQMFFYIAVDPVHARDYLDDPAYRYTRIGYPLLAGALSLFDPRVVPWTLLLLNLAMIGVGVLALAAWLRERGAPAWMAAAYGLYPGTLVGLQRDTSEVMAYGLVAVGTYLCGRRRLALAGAAFGAAVLTRETAGLFPLLFAIAEVAGGTGSWRDRVRANWRAAGILLLLSFGPFVLLKAFLLVWLRSFGLTQQLGLVPFGGILAYWPWQPGQVEEVRSIVLPAILCGAAATWALLRGIMRVEVWALLVNVLVLVVFLGQASWVDLSSSGRITMGVALAAVMAAAVIARRGWFWAGAALWLSPMATWIVLPTAAYFLAAVGRHL
jgi:hypothetical protein